MYLNNLKKLNYFNVSAAVKTGRDIITLFADIDSLDTIKDSSFLCEDATISIELDRLCDQMRGQKITQLELNKSMSFHCHLAYQHLRDEYVGNNIGFHLNQNKDIKSLICRCMGVYTEQLDDLIISQHGERKTIIANCAIGQVCGSCREDFNEYLRNHAYARYYRDGKTIASWIMLAQDELDNYYDPNNKVLNALNKTVLSFEKDVMKLRISGERNELKRTELNQIFQTFINERLKLKAKVSIVF